MNKLNHAFAMLTAGSAVALSPAAHAVTLYGTWTNVVTGYVETFQLQSNGGVADALPDFTDFTLTNDSLGNTLATVGDNTTGFKATFTGEPVDSYFGTGPAGSSPFNGQTFDSFKPALYSSSMSPGVLQAGTYLGDIFLSEDSAARASVTNGISPSFDGAILVLSGVPEPDAWALLIAGAAMVGGALRASRRKGALSPT